MRVVGERKRKPKTPVTHSRTHAHSPRLHLASCQSLICSPSRPGQTSLARSEGPPARAPPWWPGAPCVCVVSLSVCKVIWNGENGWNECQVMCAMHMPRVCACASRVHHIDVEQSFCNGHISKGESCTRKRPHVTTKNPATLAPGPRGAKSVAKFQSSILQSSLPFKIERRAKRVSTRAWLRRQRR
jgi:hypothetical protein